MSLEPSRTPARRTDNLDPQGTRHSGWKGLFELALRRFKLATRILATLPLYGVAIALMGLAAAPGIGLFRLVLGATESWSATGRALVLGPAAAAAYFAYGFSLLLILPAANALLRLKLKEWRGPYGSFELLPWFVHNGLTYLARYTFLELVTPTPFSVAFYRMMGMRIGRGTELNTTHISDPSLIRIGDRVTVGGSATIIAHYAAGGYMVLAPVVIEDGATIGLKAIIMGGVRIGERARILPNSVVLPKTTVPAGETWGGIPAARIDTRSTRSDAA